MSAFVRSGQLGPGMSTAARASGRRRSHLPEPRRAPSLRGRLVLLVASVGLALVALAGLAVWHAYHQARAPQQDELLHEARAVSRLADREFASGAALLRGLAVSPQLVAGDDAGFDAEARAAAPPGTWVAAFDRNLRRRVSTVIPRLAFESPAGEVGVSPEIMAVLRDVLATGRVRMSGVFYSMLARRKVIAVAVPAAGPDGVVHHVLVLTLPLDRIAAALAGMHLPGVVRASLGDAEGRTVASVGANAPAPGSLPDGPVGRLIGAGATPEVVTVPAADGDEVVAVARSRDSFYVGAVIVPADLFAAPARRAVLGTALLGGLIALAGCLAAALMARRLAASLRTLATPGGPAALAVPGARRGLREVAALARELARATADRDRAIAELRALFDASPVGLVRCDAAGRILDANEAFRRLLRLGPDSFADGRLRWEAVTPREWHGIDEAAIAEALARGRCLPYEKEYLRADMHRVPALVSFVRLDRASGQVAGFLVDLTARKQAEMALREAGTRLRAIFNGAFEFIFLLTPDGMLVEANRAALDFAGVGLARVIGRPFWETVWWAGLPAEQARLRAAVAEAASGTFARYEVALHGAGGRVATVDFSLRPVRDEAGAVILLIPEARDVTGWRSAQAALASSERRLALAQEAAGLGVWEWRVGADHKTWSDQQYRIYGLDPSEPAPRLERWLSLVVPEDRERARAVLAEAAAGGTDYRMEFSIRRNSDGAIRRIFAAARGDRDDEGRVRSLVGVNLDITEERHTRAALRSAETRLLLAQETAGIGFFDCAVATGAMAVTPTWRSILGLPAEAQQGLRLDDWLGRVHPADRDRVTEAARAALADGDSLDAEFRVLRADTGEERWLNARGCRIDAETGAGPRLIGVTRDITEAKVAEAMLTDANTRLESRVSERTRALTDAARALSAEIRRGEEVRAALLQAQKLGVIGELTSGVVHDFNNVLTAINGTFEVLDRRVEEPVARRVLDQGQRAVARAAGLIRQLLAFARKADALRPAVIDPARMLRDALGFLRQGAGPTVACVVDAPDGVWPVLVDAHQLEVALLNLIVNARDAMPEGGTITLGATNVPAGSDDVPGRPPAPDMVALTVRDGGTGMTREVMARAAEPFFTTKDRARGTGLGLAMVQEFAARVGGRLRIESREGEGTTVAILLPRADGHLPLPLPYRGDAAAEAAAPERGGVILLVEANEPARIAIAGFLRGLGYTVIDTARAETGLVLASALDSLDLVLADAEPPEGAALAARVRAERPGTPILSITACAGAASAGSAIGRPRPYSQEDLAASVRAVLARAAKG